MQTTISIDGSSVAELAANARAEDDAASTDFIGGNSFELRLTASVIVKPWLDVPKRDAARRQWDIGVSI